MSRNRTSARKAGTSFERLVADYLAWALNDDRIDRRIKRGSQDRGDITGLKHMGARLVIECKNTTRLNLAQWLKEAQIEAGNDDAAAGLIVHKRHGKSRAQDQLVTMTLQNLTSLLNGYPTPDQPPTEKTKP